MNTTTDQSSSPWDQVDPDLRGMIPRYLERRSLELASIEKLIEEKNFQELKFIGHKLKGNAATFGLGWLGEKGGLLEEAANQENSEELSALGREMNNYIQTVRSLPLPG